MNANLMYKTKISGTGAYLPEKKLTNYDLEKLVDTNHEWIVERTGIHSRSVAADNQNTSDLGFNAAIEAIENAKVDPAEIDFIYFATNTPDYHMPNTASVLQKKLMDHYGIKNKCGSLDIVAACSGFLYGLTLADAQIKSGMYKNILLVGGEVLSRFVDYEDRTTCILFGDGAGAAVLTRSDDNSASEFLGHKLSADGNLSHLIYFEGGGCAMPASNKTVEEKKHFVRMNGREIFKNAVRTMATTCKKVLEQSGVDIEQVDWLVPHQANERILEAVAKYFEYPKEKVIVEIKDMGNISAGTIPVAFHKAISGNKIKRGDNVMFTAFGGGLTSGSLLVRY